MANGESERLFNQGLNASDWRTKEQYYQQAVNIDRNYVDAWINLGIARHQLRNNSAAIDALEMANSKNPDNRQKILLLYHLALIHEKDHKLSDAIKFYEQLVDGYQRRYNVSKLWEIKPNLHMNPGHMTEIENLVAKAMCNCGSCYNKMRQAENAKRWFERAIEYFPFDNLSWFNYGLVNIKSNGQVALYSFLLAANNGLEMQAGPYIRGLQHEGFQPRVPNLDIPQMLKNL